MVIPASRVSKIFKTSENSINPFLSRMLKLDFFFTSKALDYYEFEKVVVFCILYGNADLHVKAQYLFEVMATVKIAKVEYNSAKVARVILHVTIISCIIMAEFVNANAVSFYY